MVSDRAKSRSHRFLESRAKEKKQMSILRTVTTTVFCLALMGAVFSPTAKADEWNRKIVMTFRDRKSVV